MHILVLSAVSVTCLAACAFWGRGLFAEVLLRLLAGLPVSTNTGTRLIRLAVVLLRLLAALMVLGFSMVTVHLGLNEILSHHTFKGIGLAYLVFVTCLCTMLILFPPEYD